MPTLQGVYADLVGQEHIVKILQKAVLATRTGEETQEMTHAWVFTGPPGQDVHRPQSPFPKLFSAPTIDAAHATNVNLQPMAHTPNLKSFAPKVFPSKLIKFANFLKPFPWHLPLEAGA